MIESGGDPDVSTKAVLKYGADSNIIAGEGAAG